MRLLNAIVGSILQGSVDHACPSVSMLSQVTENSVIGFVVLGSETVFTAILASVSINYRSTWVCDKLVSVLFQLHRTFSNLDRAGQENYTDGRF